MLGAGAGRRGGEERFRPFREKIAPIRAAPVEEGEDPYIVRERRGRAAKSETLKAQACSMAGVRDHRGGLRGEIKAQYFSLL